MKKILFMLCILLTINAAAQKIQLPTAPPEKRTLVADETEVVQSGEKKFRVITSNDEIAVKMSTKYKATLLLSYNGYRKTTKYKGKELTYWECSFYFNNEDYNTVMSFVAGGFK